MRSGVESTGAAGAAAPSALVAGSSTKAEVLGAVKSTYHGDMTILPNRKK